jgi:hypothetical protein
MKLLKTKLYISWMMDAGETLLGAEGVKNDLYLNHFESLRQKDRILTAL